MPAHGMSRAQATVRKCERVGTRISQIQGYIRLSARVISGLEPGLY